jgi:peptidoglycan/LPS O-acetylase OafA/YrhL
MNQENRTLPRLDRLTSLRALAAAAVVVLHVSRYVRSTPVWDISARLATAVTFFFMLSGFVLTWAGEPTKGYYRRRAARVLPLYVGLWAVALAIIYLLYDRTQPWTHTAGSLFLVQAWVPRASFYFATNGVAWSLSVEAFLYLVFPLVVALLRGASTSTRWVIVAGCLLVDALLVPVLAQHLSRRVAEWLTWVCPATQLPTFIIGVVLALELRRGWRPKLSPFWSTVMWLVAGAATLALPAPYWRVAPMLVPFALLIAHSAMADLGGRAGRLQSPLLVRAGTWAYAVYLSHSLVIFVVEKYLGSRAFSLAPWQGLLLAFETSCAAFAVGGTLHTLVERPAERWLRGSPPRVEVPAG